MFAMGDAGSPYARFRRSLETGNSHLVLAAARELPHRSRLTMRCAFAWACEASPKRSQARGRSRDRGDRGPEDSPSVSSPFDRVRARLPAIVPSECLAIHRATARKFWRLRIGPQLEPLGKDCPHTR